VRTELLRKLEQIEAAFSLPGSNRHLLEAMSDVEVQAWEAWFEAGEPEDADAWVDEWISTQPEPRAANGHESRSRATRDHGGPSPALRMPRSPQRSRENLGATGARRRS